MENNKRQFKMSLKTINLVITALIIFFCVLLGINTAEINRYNKRTLEISEAHIAYTDIAMQLNLGSDILTEQVRLFAETGDTQYLDGYFEEAKVSRHRDAALEELEDLKGVHTEVNVKRAVHESERLMEREYYAMRLTAKGYEIPLDMLPEEVRNVTLLPHDQKLSAEEARQEARAMLFDNIYLGAKNRIKTNTNYFLDNMVDVSMYEYKTITKKLQRNLVLQIIIILATLLAIIITRGFISNSIIRPIIKAAKNIKDNKSMDMPSHLAEMNALNDSYNSLREHNKELLEKLEILAHEDALTEMGSRFAYNNYTGKIKDKKKEIILFLFDVDGLRETNNREGHAKGDELLADAGQCIKKVFGIYDYENCFRVGGDEFVAFIEDEPRKRANAFLASFYEETKKRGVGVSVGYSYTDDISKTSINAMFNDADTEMYKAKYGNK